MLNRRATGAVLILALALCADFGCDDPAPSSKSAPGHWNWPSTYLPELKTERNSDMQKALSAGMYERIYPLDSVTYEIVVGDSYIAASSEDKSAFAELAYCWAIDQNPNVNNLCVWDRNSHHQIGDYDIHGLMELH
jgi:hypothetical protein